MTQTNQLLMSHVLYLPIRIQPKGIPGCVSLTCRAGGPQRPRQRRRRTCPSGCPCSAGWTTQCWNCWSVGWPSGVRQRHHLSLRDHSCLHGKFMYTMSNECCLSVSLSQSSNQSVYLSPSPQTACLSRCWFFRIRCRWAPEIFKSLKLFLSLSGSSRILLQCFSL